MGSDDANTILRMASSATMHVIFGGRERRVSEFEAHGLVLDGVTDVSGGRSLLESRIA